MVLNQKIGGCPMTHAQAMRILDKVRDGVPYPEKIVTIALQMTGDLVE